MSERFLLVSEACPGCARSLPLDPRFPAWCAQCGWGLHPDPEPTGRLARSRRRIEAALGRSLLAAARQRSLGRPGIDGARIASYALAAAVHLSTLLLLWWALILTLLLPRPLEIVVAAAVVLALCVLRPRPGRLPRGTVVLAPSDAPALHELVGDVAAAVGSRRPDVVAVSGQVNAWFTRTGVRRRRLLCIGLPLWVSLDEQARVALLAHELGHDVNGDVSHGLVVGLAERTLRQWSSALGSERYEPIVVGDLPLVTVVGAAVGRLMFRPLVWLVGGLRSVLWLLRLRSGQRAELYADVLSAQVAGRDATARCLDTALLATSIDRALSAAVVRREPGSLLDVAAGHVASIPDHERLRLRRLAALEHHRTDASHPLTAQRIAVVASMPPTRPRVVLGGTRTAAIDAELTAIWSSIDRTERERRRASLAGVPGRLDMVGSRRGTVRLPEEPFDFRRRPPGSVRRG